MMNVTLLALNLFLNWHLINISSELFWNYGDPEFRPAVASWYGDDFHGRITACGEVYDMNAMTCAHKTLPIGTILEVTTGERSIVVIVNDRGPYIEGRDIDLSLRAFEELAPLNDGIAEVSFRVLRREIRSTMLYNLN